MYMTLIFFMQSGGIGYDVPAGRRDSKISLASDTFTNLPPPFFNVDQLTQLFANKGFTQEEMVTLSGKNLRLFYNGHTTTIHTTKIWTYIHKLWKFVNVDVDNSWCVHNMVCNDIYPFIKPSNTPSI